MPIIYICTVGFRPEHGPMLKYCPDGHEYDGIQRAPKCNFAPLADDIDG